MASKAPSKCPACGSESEWVHVNESNKGFSVGKAAGGGCILGPIGLLFGGLGKTQHTYFCRSCGFKEDYDKEADAVLTEEQIAQREERKKNDEELKANVGGCLIIGIVALIVIELVVTLFRNLIG